MILSWCCVCHFCSCFFPISHSLSLCLSSFLVRRKSLLTRSPHCFRTSIWLKYRAIAIIYPLHIFYLCTSRTFHACITVQLFICIHISVTSFRWIFIPCEIYIYLNNISFVLPSFAKSKLILMPVSLYYFIISKKKNERKNANIFFVSRSEQLGTVVPMAQIIALLMEDKHRIYPIHSAINNDNTSPTQRMKTLNPLASF